MEKSKGEKLCDKLFDEGKSGFSLVSDDKKEVIFKFCDEYISFLNGCKTERECVSWCASYLEERGFKNIDDVSSVKIGDKVYYVNRGKAIYACVVGSEVLEEGVNLVGAHIDSPRLDLKPRPLYEEGDLALFKTHYYGGIKKYQWTCIPLAIHGVICLSDGSKVNVCIGEDESDPVFTITDLLPHLAGEQMKKSLSKGVSGEDLNVLVGSIPYSDEKVSDPIKLNILNILYEKYGIAERDFGSAELEVVPAFRARSLGFDRSMVAGYGQDDRSCAYTSLRSLCDLDAVKRSCILILADKEEVGSMGNTGMCSREFENFMNMLLSKAGQNGYGVLDKVLCNSKMLSADVTSGSDPTYASVDDKINAAYVGRGLCLCKYTGHGGKSEASDASAEFVAYVRGVLEKRDLMYQMADMGKVDSGGGGTIAYILADRGVDVLDAGVPILSMHAPYEVSSKFDIYNAYECYKAFYEN